MEAQAKSKSVVNQRVNVVVAEGRVTLEELHKSLDVAIKQIGGRGGCLQCGLVGFDLIFLRGDPEFAKQFQQIPNIQGGFIQTR